MKGRTPTKAEKEHMDSMREIGCICCILDFVIVPYEVPSEYTAIHHIEGKTKEGAHFLTIPLCPSHHQNGPIRVHGKKKEFIAKYGTEYELLEACKELASRNV